MQAAHRWQPILPAGGDLYRAAWDAVYAVACSLLKRDYTLDSRSRLGDWWNYRESLLYAYLARGSGEGAWAERALSQLQAASEHAAVWQGRLGLYDGLCGLAWTIRHVEALLGQTCCAPEILEEIDQNILEGLRDTEWRGPYDLVNGLTGMGVYFLETWPSSFASEGLALILNYLVDRATPVSSGITWRTPPELLSQWDRKQAPHGYYNLGVSHGVPGVIFFLDELKALRIQSDRVEPLLTGAVEWLIRQRRPHDTGFVFGSWVPVEENPAEETPMNNHKSPGAVSWAWCYGDLGVIPVLRRVACRSGQDNWLEISADLFTGLLDMLGRGVDLQMHCLCHGSAGVAHLFNRIYQKEGDPRCLEAAQEWYRRTIQSRSPGNGVGGFSSPPLNPQAVSQANPSFLDGALGTALSLLSAVTSIEPSWDRQLLLSGRSCFQLG
jgi:lantibiotic modifying enzyme